MQDKFEIITKTQELTFCLPSDNPFKNYLQGAQLSWNHGIS